MNDRDDFCGLSPSDMSELLYDPFSSNGTIVFNTQFIPPVNAPIMLVLGNLIAAISHEGVKATPKGNLPMTICRGAADSLLSLNLKRGRFRYERFRNEEDILPLHLVRLLLVIGGYLKKYKGRFSWTKKGIGFKELTPGEQYVELLKLAATQFNWGYFDSYPDVPIIQMGFAYTLYLVQRFGDEPRSESFYSDRFLTAFPMGLVEVGCSDFQDERARFHACYEVRSFDRFMAYFGLIDPDWQDTGMGKEAVLQKTCSLDDLVVFNT